MKPDKAFGDAGKPEGAFGDAGKPDTSSTDTGLYIHLPFCHGKCPYCDFYSGYGSPEIQDAYCRALKQEIISRDRTGAFFSPEGRRFDSVYFGGGTPNVFGGKRLTELLQCLKSEFFIPGDAEITSECNPAQNTAEFFEACALSGVNRISMGLQSSDTRELKVLGRCAGADDAAKSVLQARQAGINNISLDLMLGISGQTMDSLKKSIEKCLELGACHISAYILKIEEGTPYYGKQDKLNLPSEDETCELYLMLCEELEKNGLLQYEISNFAIPGKESRHNLKYWHDDEYLGLGAAAHSFISGKRFYFERDTEGFISGNAPLYDGAGGDKEEYLMLALRLTEGVSLSRYRSRFGAPVPPQVLKTAEKYAALGLTKMTKDGFSLTRNGFLLSNTLIADIIFSTNA